MYILKIKGNGKIPDHIQLRDASFTLIAYFRVGNYTNILKKHGFNYSEKTFTHLIDQLPYGIVQKFNNNQ